MRELERVEFLKSCQDQGVTTLCFSGGFTMLRCLSNIRTRPKTMISMSFFIKRKFRILNGQKESMIAFLDAGLFAILILKTETA